MTLIRSRRRRSHWTTTALSSTPSYTGEMFVEAIYNDLNRASTSATPAAESAPKGK